MADDAGVRIHLLGGFEVTVADHPVAADAWRLRKAKTLVKLLALARGYLLPEDRFEDWTEGPREALRERHLGLLVE